MITQEQLHELFSYDAATGNLVRLVSRRSAKAGTVAGALSRTGYVHIKISNKNYQAHRLVWLYHHGVMPKDQLDHINGIKHDNRIENLREATNAENLQNRRKALANNKSCRLLGVSRNGKRWQAHIGLNGKKHYIGTYDTPEQAHAAYLQAKVQMHPYQMIAA